LQLTWPTNNTSNNSKPHHTYCG